jgi:GT2 family glycosyltransferase
LYWGCCYLVRASELRELAWPESAPLSSLAHHLALRLAGRSESILRVPSMLWHLQQSTVEPASAARVGDYGSMNAGQAARSALSSDRACVVICSRNPKQLRKCLKSVLPTLDRRHEVIVVAHYTERAAEMEQIAARERVRLISYKGAFHFGLMNSLGVAASDAPLLCLLNDDIYPLTRDWLELLLAQAARPNVGVAGALLLYPDRTIQHAGMVVGGRYLPAHVGRFQTESPYWPWLRMTREVTAVTGACMAVRRSVWNDLGGFDMRFPVNFNDVDFCLRAAERGFRVLIEARAVLIHEESMTRLPAVRPEESDLLHELWGQVMSVPDKFFHPQLGNQDDSIDLPAPWTVLR